MITRGGPLREVIATVKKPQVTVYQQIQYVLPSRKQLNVVILFIPVDDVTLVNAFQFFCF